ELLRDIEENSKTDVVARDRGLARLAGAAVRARVDGVLVAHVRLQAAVAVRRGAARDLFGAPALRVLRHAANVSALPRRVAVGRARVVLVLFGQGVVAAGREEAAVVGSAARSGDRPQSEQGTRAPEVSGSNCHVLRSLEADSRPGSLVGSLVGLCSAAALMR